MRAEIFSGSPLAALTEEPAHEPNERRRLTLVLDMIVFPAVFVNDEDIRIYPPTSVGKTISPSFDPARMSPQTLTT